MTVRHIKSSIDKFLKPLGFEKSGLSWIRPAEQFLEVITFQRTSFNDACTLNCGVYSEELCAELWEESVFRRAKITDALCVVRERLGSLASDGKTDQWWGISDPSSPEKMLAAVQKFMFPFFQQNSSFEAMIGTLEPLNRDKRTNFPDSYFLALLYFRTGQKNKGCSLLFKLRDKAIKLSGQDAPLNDKAGALLATYGCSLN
jgi:Domain of unknown function (DUF4304)